ncbi:MAG: putative acyl-CoA dehydrogenase [Myxococcota bacterium]|nr:putative acyl-CoA dehydrogenase [Myxococcota bacterium]
MSTEFASASWLLNPAGSREFFTPERFSEEQKAIAQSAREFCSKEIMPHSKDIEAKKPGLMRELAQKAGELGFLSLEVPERFGGLGAEKSTSMLLTEALTEQGSFTVTVTGHTGIGTLPIVYFGDEAQKAKYLPKLASGEWMGAYALTEAGSGSDALAARAKAVLSPDGRHYILNGVKQWITNGGFADVFTVFAKIDGEHFTGFIVERGYPGVSTGPEEHKMGIRGSSTVELILENAMVPVENVLGEIGKGHRIAFNILNIGRLKLCGAAVGGSKQLIDDAVKYALERKQFHTPIANFGMIRRKFADMAVVTYSSEALTYYLSGLLDERISKLDKSSPSYDEDALKIIEDYSIECSIAKVFGSEAVHKVVEEAVQIHGGYGYVSEFRVEQAYRDARINRIFEGTNEINRLVTVGTLLKRAMKGQLDLMGAVARIIEEEPPMAAEGPLGNAERALDLSKRCTLFAINAAVMKHMQGLNDQQELLELMADMLIDTAASDATVHRAMQAAKDDPKRAGHHRQLATVFAIEAYRRVLRNGKNILCALEQGDSLDALLAGIRRYEVRDTTDLIGLKKSIAETVAGAGGWALTWN